MKKLLIIALFLFVGCGAQRAPIPVGVVPKPYAVTAEDEQYGHQVFVELNKQFPVDRNDRNINRVRDLVDRLTLPLGTGLDPWNVYVLQSDKVKNAAATRGNFVFVWTAMLDQFQNDDELSTVLAHEIGHVLAGHTQANPAEEANRMITGIAGEVTEQVLMRAGGGYGLAAGIAGSIVSAALEGLIVNPEQQRQELEADQIGLFIMAEAGIDPQNAVSFWQQVADDPSFGGGGGLQFLSTHPSSTNRLEKLKQILPDAEARYKEVKFYYSSPASKKSKQGKKTNDEFNVNKW